MRRLPSTSAARLGVTSLRFGVNYPVPKSFEKNEVVAFSSLRRNRRLLVGRESSTRRFIRFGVFVVVPTPNGGPFLFAFMTWHCPI